MNFRYYKTERLIPFIIALSVICSYFSIKIERALTQWHVISQASEWIDIFSTLSLVILIFLLINNFGWKYKIFRWLVNLPDLNGRYVGVLRSSFIGETGQPETKECALEIKQTASYIHIFAYFGDIGTHDKSSRSLSVSEQLVQEYNGLFLLYYIFTNESEALKEKLSNHLGTAALKYYPDTKTLDGHYYNQRRNIGTIEVKFIQEQLLGRLVP